MKSPQVTDAPVESTEQVEQYKMDVPRNEDFVRANLLDSGDAGQEIISLMEDGKMYNLETFLSVMREITEEKFYEDFFDLFVGHRDPKSDPVSFRRRGEDGSEVSFTTLDDEIPYLRVSYKKSDKKGERMTIDSWFTGSPVRIRVQPKEGANKYSFTPQMVSELEYDQTTNTYSSGLQNFESDAQFKHSLVRDFVQKMNDALSRAQREISPLRPSQMKKREDLQNTVRDRTFRTIGG